MFCWHKWSKWEQYAEAGVKTYRKFPKERIPYSETRQKRRCMKCGKVQDEYIC